MVIVSPNLKSIVDQDGAVILDILHDRMTTLNTMGFYVWERLQRGLQVDAIVGELARDTGADHEMVAKDIGDFIGQLKSRQLIVAVQDGAPSFHNG